MENKYAICFFGAVGLSNSRINDVVPTETPRLIEYDKVSEINHKHIINVNNPIDVFVHCWTPTAQKGMIECYHPKSHLFESNQQYADELKSLCFTPNRKGEFNRMSFFLSIKKSIELMLSYADSCDIKYEKVIMFRPDIVLHNDINLKEIHVKNDVIISNYSSAHPGDFCYIMNMNTSKKFKTMYDKIINTTSYNLRTMPVDLANECGLKIEFNNQTILPEMSLARKIRNFNHGVVGA